MWSGLGVNYKSSQANWDNDIAYFKSIGLTTIRPSLSSFPNSAYTPGSDAAVVGSIEWWRTCAARFENNGFTVVYGIARATGVSGTFDATAWATYRANVLADAAYNQSIGFALDYYQIGNEIEGIINNTTYTQTQLIADLKQLATDVKAVYPLANKIIYSTYDLSGTMFNNWISAGLGDIDVLGGNVYAQTGSNGRSFIFGDMGKLSLMLDTFGADRFILTEFGIDGNATQYNATSQTRRLYNMRHIYAGIRELGFTQAIAYSYVGYLNQDNDFALKNTDGTFDVQWDVLLTDNGRRTFSNVDGVTSDASSLRVQSGDRTVAGTRSDRVLSPYPVYFKPMGNMSTNTIAPVDTTPLKIGSSSDFSISFKGRLRAKTTPGNTSSHTIARCDYSNGNNKGYLFQVTNSTGRLRVLVGNTTYDSDAGLVPYDTDVVIKFTMTGTTLMGYVNGVAVTWFPGSTGSKTIVRQDGDNNALIWFGAETGGVGSAVGGVQGRIYELMSYKGLWDSEELAGIEEGITPRVDIHYKFTRGLGRYVADLSGNLNHGLMGVESWGRN